MERRGDRKQTLDMGAWYVRGPQTTEEEQPTFKTSSGKLHGKNKQTVGSLLLILCESKPHVDLRSTFTKIVIFGRYFSILDWLTDNHPLKHLLKAFFS